MNSHFQTPEKVVVLALLPGFSGEELPNRFMRFASALFTSVREGLEVISCPAPVNDGFKDERG